MKAKFFSRLISKFLYLHCTGKKAPVPASTQHNCEVPPPGVYILHYIALMLDLAAEDAKKQAMEGDSRYNFALIFFSPESIIITLSGTLHPRLCRGDSPRIVTCSASA